MSFYSLEILTAVCCSLTFSNLQVTLIADHMQFHMENIYPVEVACPLKEKNNCCLDSNHKNGTKREREKENES